MNTIAESIAITFVLITMVVCFFILYKEIDGVHNDIRDLMRVIREQKDKQNSKGDGK